MNKKNKFKNIAPKDKRAREEEADPTHKVRRRARLSRGARVGVWIFALAAVGALCFAVLTLFSGASIDVYPKTAAVELNDEFSAYYQGSEGGDIKYEMMEVSAEAEREVKAQGVEKVEKKASGKIIIYNDYKRSSQKLIDNTRFKAPNGLIYKIDDPVRVPGQKTKNGELVPGEIEVDVYAAEPGSKYNITKGAEFSVPGLKGTDLYNDFYAKASTDISGGVSEKRPVVSSENRKSLVNEWENEIEKKIKEEALSQVPEGYYLLDALMSISTEIVSIEKVSEGKAKIKMRADLKGALLSKQAVAQMIAERKIEGYKEAPVYIGADNLSSKLVNSQNFNLDNKSPFDFKLNGNVHLVWKVNKDQIEKEIAGRQKTALGNVLSDYEGVEKAEATVRPFWRSEFPIDRQNINIKVHKSLKQ